jgi:polyhydroxybutyrate depolymerase
MRINSSGVRVGLVGVVLLIAICGFVMCAAGKRRSDKGDPSVEEALTHKFSLRHKGVLRTYKLHVPPDYDGKTKMPVVIALHGGMGSAGAIEKQSRISQQADKYGFIVAYPEGLGLSWARRLARSWNGGTCCDPARKRKADDVGFIGAMLDRMAKKFKIDPTRVYATGISNGAIMSYKLACDLSDRIAAIAPVAGPNATATCSPSKPVSVIHFHGSGDPCSPFEGGPGGGCAARALGMKPKPIFDTPPIAEIVRQWAKRNGAPAKGELTLKKGSVSCTTYGPGRQGSEATLCVVKGGGHTWPGGWEGLSESLVGAITHDVSANELMWEFFKRHARK